MASGTLDTRYFHWDDLQRRDPPEGLSREDWWVCLKLRRRSEYRQIPLCDKEGSPFQWAMPDPVPERLHEIDKQAAGTIQMPEAIVNPETRNSYLIRSLFEEGITSSLLEGAATTRQQGKEMLSTGREPRSTDERMILNNYRAMRRIGELRREPLTRELVLSIHREITADTLEDPATSGRLRRATDLPVFVSDDQERTFYVPPPPDSLEDRMACMCDFANGQSVGQSFIHPVLRSIMLHFWLAYDHPFVDGNGRTARALFYWSMLHHGYWLFEFVSISQVLLKAPTKYARAFLLTESDDNDLTYFLLHHLDVITRSLDALNEYVQRKTKEIHHLEVQLKGLSHLNYRQRALMADALRHPHRRYTIGSHQVCHDVVYATARTDLLDLERRGLLRAIKVGRRRHYLPVNDLSTLLQKMDQ